MNVSKAGQLLSESVAMALEYYRDKEESGRYKKLFQGNYSIAFRNVKI